MSISPMRCARFRCFRCFRCFRSVRTGAVALGIGIATACSRPDQAPSDVVRSDSSGVQIVTSGAADTELPWRFDEIDVFRDSAGEPYLFSNVLNVGVLTDRAGRTYVLTNEPAIVRFGRTGRPELRFGRRGGGPGEFRLPLAIGSMGDTIWALDAAKRALVRFAPDLSPMPDLRMEGAIARADMLAFRTGGFWFRRTDITDSLVHQSIFADTAGSAPLHRLELRRGFPVEFSCVGATRATAVFAPQLMMNARGPRVLVHAQPAYALWLYEGPRAVASVRRPLAVRAPTGADVRLIFPNGMPVGMGRNGQNCTIPVEEIIEKQGAGPAMPFVFDVALLPDGSIWALRTPHVASPVVDVFGSDGVYQGTVHGLRLPVALHPNGELIVPRLDEASGGTVLVRMRVTR